MSIRNTVLALLQDIADQKEDSIASYFHEDARIRWHNTKEEFDVTGFVKATCTYPGEWSLKVERWEEFGDLVVVVYQLREARTHTSNHVTSFIEFKKDQIVAIDEYYGSDEEAPEWRKKLQVSQPVCL